MQTTSVVSTLNFSEEYATEERLLSNTRPPLGFTYHCEVIEGGEGEAANGLNGIVESLSGFLTVKELFFSNNYLKDHEREGAKELRKVKLSHKQSKTKTCQKSNASRSESFTNKTRKPLKPNSKCHSIFRVIYSL